MMLLKRAAEAPVVVCSTCRQLDTPEDEAAVRDGAALAGWLRRL